MKKQLVVALGLAVLCSTLPAAAAGPKMDLLAGTIFVSLPTPFGTFPAQVHVNAKSQSSGGPGFPAQGQFFVRLFGTPVGDVEFAGDVICLTAIGNSAWVQGVIVTSNSPLVPPGFGILSRYIDNGQGANDPPDEAVGFLTPPPGPVPFCPPIPIATSPETQGNIEIKDGI